MLTDALLAYLHFAMILFLASVLGAQYFLLRTQPGPSMAAAVSRADIGYGIASLLVIASGLLRVFYGAKGWAFYAANPVFWTKMGLFILVGLVSILPTLRFIRWRRALRSDASFVPPAVDVLAMRRVVLAEMHLLALIPLAAVLMARGLGQ